MNNIIQHPYHSVKMSYIPLTKVTGMTTTVCCSLLSLTAASIGNNDIICHMRFSIISYRKDKRCILVASSRAWFFVVLLFFFVLKIIHWKVHTWKMSITAACICTFGWFLMYLYSDYYYYYYYRVM